MADGNGDDDYQSIADLYDHVALYRDRDDVQFFVDAARGSAGPVLELGCGTGRVLIPTARAGIEIVGLDVSPGMLGICRSKLEQEPREVRERVELVHGDMRDFRLARSFGLVTVPFRGFQHLTTVAEQMASLSCIRDHLQPGGTLILDLFNPWLELLVAHEDGAEFGEEPEFVMPDGRRVVRRHRFLSSDRFRQVNRVEMIHDVTHPDGTEEQLSVSFDFRYLFRFEAEHLLARCGFELEHVYSDYARSPFGSHDPGELVLVARRAQPD
jgi:SAM-dependent methyltransferase